MFRAPDGTEIEGWVLRREVEGRTPLLLDVHGGPHNAWGPAFDGDPNIVEVYVGHLRRKLDEPFGRRSIETVRGAGYRLHSDGAN